MASGTGQDTGSHYFACCNDVHCSTTFKYLDWVAHSKIDGPDPRDHFANERNFLSWLRTGMTMVLIGFMTLLDLRAKNFAPSYSLPWSEEPVPVKTRIVAYVFIALGFCSIITSVLIYFRNQRQILRRLIDVGHGWAGYTLALLITLFVCFIMTVAITEA